MKRPAIPGSCPDCGAAPLVEVVETDSLFGDTVHRSTTAACQCGWDLTVEFTVAKESA